jgi:hypothetical protein
MRCSFWWVDFKKGVAAVLATQSLPFHNDEAVEVLKDFKKLVNGV